MSPPGTHRRTRSIGIFGTAKNTGKTTTVNALIRSAAAQGLSLGLTGIGYDGEAVDNVTGLPKPRLWCPAGTVVATARRTLELATAGLEILSETGITTALGEVVVARVTRPGLALLAGPNRGTDLRQVLERMQASQPGLVLVDGALNRLSPMAVVDGLVMATGAARQPDPGTLAAEAAALVHLLDLPLARVPRPGPEQPAEEQGRLVVGSLLTPEAVAQAARRVPGEGTRGRLTVEVRGAVTEAGLRELARLLGARLARTTLVLPVGPRLVAGVEPRGLWTALEEMAAAGARIRTTRRIPIVAVTVNPFFPRLEGERYRPDWVAARELQAAVARAVDRPVHDVVRQGGARLLEVIQGRKNLYTRKSPETAKDRL